MIAFECVNEKRRVMTANFSPRQVFTLSACRNRFSTFFDHAFLCLTELLLFQCKVPFPNQEFHFVSRPLRSRHYIIFNFRFFFRQKAMLQCLKFYFYNNNWGFPHVEVFERPHFYFCYIPRVPRPLGVRIPCTEVCIVLLPLAISIFFSWPGRDFFVTLSRSRCYLKWSGQFNFNLHK